MPNNGVQCFWTISIDPAHLEARDNGCAMPPLDISAARPNAVEDASLVETILLVPSLVPSDRTTHTRA